MNETVTVGEQNVLEHCLIKLKLSVQQKIVITLDCALPFGIKTINDNPIFEFALVDKR